MKKLILMGIIGMSGLNGGDLDRCYNLIDNIDKLNKKVIGCISAQSSEMASYYARLAQLDIIDLRLECTGLNPIVDESIGTANTIEKIYINAGLLASSSQRK